jgi:hypothetical protein
VKSTRQPSDLTVVIVLKSVEMDNNGRVRAAKSKLLDLRPPASVEGLLQFVRDVPDHYSVEEQRLLSESNSGRRLSRAIVMCEKYKPNDSAMSVDGRSTIPHGEAVKNLNETKVTKYRLPLPCSLSRAVAGIFYMLGTRCPSTGFKHDSESSY